MLFSKKPNDSELLLQEIRSLNHSIANLKGSVKEVYHELFLDKNSLRARMQQAESDLTELKENMEDQQDVLNKKHDRTFQIVLGLCLALAGTIFTTFIPADTKKGAASLNTAPKTTLQISNDGLQ